MSPNPSPWANETPPPDAARRSLSHSISARQFAFQLTATLGALVLGARPAAHAASTPAAPATQPTPTPAAGKTKPIAQVLKVLPHYLDLEGRHTINPSPFDRDAYQFELRRNPALCSGMRFDVLWKTRPARPGAYTLKVELRGSKASAQNPVILSARAFARGGFSQWTRVPVLGKDYAALGELLSWRVTLWQDDRELAEQRSFLW